MRSILAALWLMPLAAFGQAGGSSPTPTPGPTRTALWRCDLPGGVYEVAVRSIISVSTHEYVVDGAARVTEMNIDTGGNTEVRFYYMEPVVATTPDGIGQSTLDRAKSLANEVASRLSPGDEPPWEKVVKSYPTTTHAHTVEYRLESLDDLQKLFNSADTAFRTGQNTQITITEDTSGSSSGE
jgi:alkaline phosphatase